MVSFFAKIIVALNSNSRPGELASGIAFGFWLALIPGGNLLWVVLFLLAFFLKHNVAVMAVSLGLFRLFIFLFDPILDSLGAAVLEYPALQDLFTSLYGVPLVSYTDFNNTLVMGGFLFGILLWVPIYVLFLSLVKIYRKRIAYKVAESKVIKFLQKIPLIAKLTAAVRKASLMV